MLISWQSGKTLDGRTDGITGMDDFCVVRK